MGVIKTAGQQKKQEKYIIIHSIKHAIEGEGNRDKISTGKPRKVHSIDRQEDKEK